MSETHDNTDDSLVAAPKVGPILGGLHPESVRKLIRDGKLKAQPMVVRGKNKRPRLYVRRSEIQRFIREEAPTLAAKWERLERASRKRRGDDDVTRYY